MAPRKIRSHGHAFVFIFFLFFFFFRTCCSIDDTPMQIYARSRCFVPTGRPSAFMATAWWRTCVYSCVYALAWCRLSDIAVVHNIMLISISFLLFMCIFFFICEIKMMHNRHRNVRIIQYRLISCYYEIENVMLNI